MNLYHKMENELRMMMRTPKAQRYEKPEVPKITAWLFREGRRPELTRVENTIDGFAKVIGCKDVEDITLSCGLSVICGADNWWSDDECTFCVGDIQVRGTVLVVGNKDDGFTTIPREVIMIDQLMQMCSLDACCV